MRFTIHYELVLIFVALFALCSSSLAADEPQQQQQQTSGRPGGLRQMIKLPDLINFEKFQQIYHKHYPTLIELMARARLYAANAFKAYVSRVEYIWRRSTKFLVVNVWSDSTVEERRKLYNYDHTQVEFVKEKPEPVADPDDVERKLEEIVEHRRDNELYGEIAADLEKSSGGASENLMRRAEERKQEDPAESLPAGKAADIVEKSGDGWFKGILKSAASSAVETVRSYLPLDGSAIDSAAADRAAAAKAKYSPVDDRYDPKANQKWIIHSHLPRKGLDDRMDEIFLDYNDSGCLAPIEEQGHCGCCYAMAAMALLEYHYCNQTKTFEHFSKQYVIDCGLQVRRTHEDPESILLIGCNGGREDYVTSFSRAYGIQLESDYPFQRVDGQCPVASPELAREQAKITMEMTKFYWLEPKKLTNDEIKSHLQSKGPMTISINLYDDFAFYGGGVDLLEKCNENEGHAMLLIGYGIEDGLEYWLVRNSQSIYWGARGHWKLSTEARDCLKFFGFTEPKFVTKDQAPALNESASSDEADSPTTVSSNAA